MKSADRERAEMMKTYETNEEIARLMRVRDALQETGAIGNAKMHESMIARLKARQHGKVR